MRREKRVDENKVEYGTVSLPLPLINKIKKRIKGTGINSVSAYVAFVLRQILAIPQKEDVLNKEEEREIRERLKNLGY